MTESPRKPRIVRALVVVYTPDTHACFLPFAKGASSKASPVFTAGSRWDRITRHMGSNKWTPIRIQVVLWRKGSEPAQLRRDLGRGDYRLEPPKRDMVSQKVSASLEFPCQKWHRSYDEVDVRYSSATRDPNFWEAEGPPHPFAEVTGNNEKTQVQ